MRWLWGSGKWGPMLGGCWLDSGSVSEVWKGMYVYRGGRAGKSRRAFSWEYVILAILEEYTSLMTKERKALFFLLNIREPVCF